MVSILMRYLSEAKIYLRLFESSLLSELLLKPLKRWDGVLVYWLLEEIDGPEVVSLNPGTIYSMDHFHISL